LNWLCIYFRCQLYACGFTSSLSLSLILIITVKKIILTTLSVDSRHSCKKKKKGQQQVSEVAMKGFWSTLFDQFCSLTYIVHWRFFFLVLPLIYCWLFAVFEKIERKGKTTFNEVRLLFYVSFCYIETNHFSFIWRIIC
jgi:hypothetical protein